jgi:radical SAM protein with 4Fe4S-binding SPASM domain
MSLKIKPPVTALYELTLKCNMKCIHCGSSAGKERKEELTTEEWNSVTDQLANVGCKRIALLGGEPFLRKDWYELSKNVLDNNMKVIYITNGYLLDGKKVEKIRKINPFVVGVSLDGSNANTHDRIRGINGSFDKSRNALLMLSKNNIPSTAVTTINKLNFKELPHIREWLLNRGITWQLQIAIPIGRFRKELMLSKEEFYSAALFIAATRRKYRIKELPIMGAHSFGYYSKVLPNHAILPNWNGCQAGITAIAIQSNGGVKGCLSLPEEFVEANIKEKRLKEIWEDPNFCSFMRSFNKQNLNGECKECKYGKKCKGGCMAASVSLTGEKFSNPYCFKLIEENYM